MRKYLLSVDGGGTSTEYCIADFEGTPLFSVFSGSTSFKSVGRAAAEENIRLGLSRLEAKGVPAADIAFGIWGLSGCDTREDQAVFEKILAACGLSPDCHRVVNDSLPAFWAAAEPPGAVIIAGTGSIALGLDSHGGAFRCGGWNYAFSDLGSGYFLGASLLRETALWLEGCREWDPVFSAAKNQLGEDPFLTLSGLTDGDDIAAFARPVLETADSPVCARIRQEAARYLQAYGKRMLSLLEENGETELKLVLSGGLFRNDEFYKLVAGGFGEIPVIRNQASPVLGGLRLALSCQKEK